MEPDVVYFEGLRYRFSGNYYQRGGAKHGERFLHRAVWVSVNGPIPDGYVIHHRDENTRNNDISNLECMSATDHHKHHFGQLWAERKADATAYKAAVDRASSWARTDKGRKFLSELNARTRAAGKYDHQDKSAFYAGRDAWAKSEASRQFNREHMQRLRADGKVGDPSDACRAKAAEWHASDEGRKWHSDLAKATWAARESVTATCTICSSTYQTYTPSRSKFCSGKCRATALRQRRKQAE